MANDVRLAPGDSGGETAKADPGPDRDERIRNSVELVATVLLAMATVLTAWSAFEATKWSGLQSIHFAQAAALRSNSAKASSSADAKEVVDVNTFVSWVAALDQERQVDPSAIVNANGSYQPNLNTLAGFLYERFRPEFKTAVNAWLALDPLNNPQAPPTPFVMPQYKQADRQRADRLEAQADHQSAVARQDNQHGDNYVLATVLFASVLFFAGVSSKLNSVRARIFTIGLAVLVLLTGVGVLATYPVQV